MWTPSDPAQGAGLEPFLRREGDTGSPRMTLIEAAACSRLARLVSSRATSKLGSPLPMLLTVDETASLLRTTRKAVYALVERGCVGGAIRVGRRILFRAEDLLDWLNQKRAPSPKE